MKLNLKLVLSVMVLLMALSCSKKNIIPIEDYRYSAVDFSRNRVAIDSIVYKDTMIIDRQSDTVRVLHSRWRYLLKNRIDTVDKVEYRTIVKREVKEVEKNSLYRWQKLLMIVGGVALVYWLFRLMES